MRASDDVLKMFKYLLTLNKYAKICGSLQLVHWDSSVFYYNCILLSCSVLSTSMYLFNCFSYISDFVCVWMLLRIMATATAGQEKLCVGASSMLGHYCSVRMSLRYPHSSELTCSKSCYYSRGPSVIYQVFDVVSHILVELV